MSIFWNWDLYVLWKLNKEAFHCCLVCYENIWLRYNYLKICNLRVQKKKSYRENQFFWYIYGKKFTKYLHGTRSLLNILMIFGIKKNYNFDPHNVFLAIATNIPQRLKTGFVLQGHIYKHTHAFIHFRKNMLFVYIKYIFVII